MLYFVLGRAGSGKTTYLNKLVSDFVNSAGEDITFIVPEQYSFETERSMLSLLGEKNAQRVDVLSFSRLAHTLLERNGKEGGKAYIDDGARAVLMSLALEGAADSLEIYARHAASPVCVNELLNASTEFKQCSISPVQLSDVAATLEDGLLSRKLSELSVITQAYDALVSRSFFDERDALTHLAQLLGEEKIFEGKIVMLDGFRGFTAQETDVLEQIMRQARAVYVTLCTETLDDRSGGTGVFSHIISTANDLMLAARKNNVPVAKPAMLSSAAKFNNFPPERKRAYKPEIAELEAALYCPEAAVYTLPAQAVTICEAQDITEECDFVARTAKKLVRETGCRFRDIAVIERTEGTYKKSIISACRKYGVPVFDDSRRPVGREVLMLLVLGAMRTVCDGFRTENILQMLKTGLFPLSAEEICELENYIITWRIDGGAWCSQWQMHPEGFGEDFTDETRQHLEYINSLRTRTVLPLLRLREALDGASGKEICGGVYTFLKDIKADEALLRLAEELSQEGFEQYALKQDKMWSLLTQLLDKLACVLGDTAVSAKRWLELFEILLSVEDTGSIPQGLDEVTVGSADRIRVSVPSAVFIVGANDGVFPLLPVSSGVFTDSERRILNESGLKVTRPCEYKVAEERFITYCALTAATDNLYVSYSLTAFPDEKLAPSEIVAQIRRILPHCRNVYAGAQPLEAIESRESAFEAAAGIFKSATPLSDALSEYFSSDEEYSGKLRALERAADKKAFAFESSEVARRLFGDTVVLSATKTETYERCPFKYFCQYGVKAKPRRAAQLDPLNTGTLIHFVLERVVSGYSAEALTEMDKKQLEDMVSGITSEYLDEKFGGRDGKSSRFMFLYERLKSQIVTVIERVVRQLGDGDFLPADFELEIGGRDGISAYALPLKDGGEVVMRGFVDRVDTMEKNGKKYLRVVDYKSGVKEFKLSDVLGGLNMQMLIYLAAIEQNGGERYGQIIPAGVLYIPARRGKMLNTRDADEKASEKNRRENSKMSGMVLRDEAAVLGMERSGAGEHIPAKIKSGELTGSLYTLEEFGRIKARLNDTLISIGEELHAGEIPAVPTAQGACEYCDYRAVCGFEDGDEVREIISCKYDDAIKILNSGGVDDAERVDT
ncbi:MAG: hypothetical protein GX051_00545 [Clostridiales bacterium]|nr:hypothetical protein [Clostridiales bacterium]